jgi:hypothetical protein
MQAIRMAPIHRQNLPVQLLRLCDAAGLMMPKSLS